MLTLGDLLDRAYDRLGGEPAKTRWFPPGPLVEYINRGLLLFRAEVEDDWFRIDIPYSEGVGILLRENLNDRNLY